jgi:hypothetical protein
MSEEAFVRIVSQIFEKMAFSSQQPRPNGRFLPDLMLELKGAKTIVDVKLLRSRTPAMPMIKRALEYVAAARAAFNTDHGLLVINLRRDNLPELHLPEDIYLIGLDDLLTFAQDDDDLIAALVDLERELSSSLGD